MKNHEKEKCALKFHPRETEKVSIKIPKDALNDLKHVAANRDMSAQALLKFYIGQGLRRDIAELFGASGTGTTETVLARLSNPKKLA